MSYKKEKINDLEGKLVMKDNEIKEYLIYRFSQG